MHQLELHASDALVLDDREVVQHGRMSDVRSTRVSVLVLKPLATHTKSTQTFRVLHKLTYFSQPGSKGMDYETDEDTPLSDIIQDNPNNLD